MRKPPCPHFIGFKAPLSAGEVVHQKVQKLRREIDGMEYSEALKRVLASPDNAELKRCYAQGRAVVQRFDGSVSEYKPNEVAA